jgi:hypothetical protein
MVGGILASHPPVPAGRAVPAGVFVRTGNPTRINGDARGSLGWENQTVTLASPLLSRVVSVALPPGPGQNSKSRGDIRDSRSRPRAAFCNPSPLTSPLLPRRSLQGRT